MSKKKKRKEVTVRNTGGEFKSNELRTFLKELGINILTSVPHMHQQNGHAERLYKP
jgi:transposase InsO family protein